MSRCDNLNVMFFTEFPDNSKDARKRRIKETDLEFVDQQHTAWISRDRHHEAYEPRDTRRNHSDGQFLGHRLKRKKKSRFARDAFDRNVDDVWKALVDRFFQKVGLFSNAEF